MDIYYEKNVTNESIDKHKKRNTVLKVFKIASVVWLVLIGVFIFQFFGWSGRSAVIIIIELVFLLAPPICSILLFTKLLANLNCEYDYYVTDEKFRIVKVINRVKRKKMLEVPLSAFVSVGSVNSENFERYAADKSVKIVAAYCNEENYPIYVYLNDETEKKLLILETDEKFLIALRRALNSTVIETELKLYISKLMNKANSEAVGEPTETVSVESAVVSVPDKEEK